MVDTLESEEIRALRAEVERLREANQALSRFAGQAAHDLQEPIRLMLGYLDLYATGHASLNSTTLIEEAREAAKRMQALVSSLLEYARIPNDVGRMAPHSLDSPLHDAIANLELRLRETAAHVEHDPLPVVRGDRTQLTRVFQNLLENSLKHGKRTGPVVRITVSSTPTHWTIAVEDDGPGWPRNGRERLFQPFAHLNTDVPGTGLGLAMVRAIMHQHGGDAQALDGTTGGARVELTFPKIPAAVEPGVDPSLATSVLLVDDNPKLRELCRISLVELGGMRVTGEAKDGNEAIEKARDLKPDVVLLDLSMPTMDGLEALHRIRQASPGSHVIILTGFKKERIEGLALHLGATAFLEKGIPPTRLADAVRHATVGSPPPLIELTDAAREQLSKRIHELV